MNKVPNLIDLTFFLHKNCGLLFFWIRRSHRSGFILEGVVVQAMIHIDIENGMQF